MYVYKISIDKMKENGFKLTKERSRRYPAQTITDADYADDKVLYSHMHIHLHTCRKNHNDTRIKDERRLL